MKGEGREEKPLDIARDRGNRTASRSERNGTKWNAGYVCVQSPEIESAGPAAKQIDVCLFVCVYAGKFDDKIVKLGGIWREEGEREWKWVLSTLWKCKFNDNTISSCIYRNENFSN